MMLGFKDRFCPMVEDGSKRHSIRGGERWKVGMRSDLYQRPRQKGMRLMFRAIVTKVETIEIRIVSDGPSPFHTMFTAESAGGGSDVIDVTTHVGSDRFSVVVDGQELSADEMDALFYRDGFRDEGTPPSQQACEFWGQRLPFKGQIVHWDFDGRFFNIPKQFMMTTSVGLQAARGLIKNIEAIEALKKCLCHFDSTGVCPVHGDVGARD